MTFLWHWHTLFESTCIFLFVQIYLYVFQAYFKVSLSLWGFSDDILKSVYLGKVTNKDKKPLSSSYSPLLAPPTGPTMNRDGLPGRIKARGEPYVLPSQEIRWQQAERGWWHHRPPGRLPVEKTGPAHPLGSPHLLLPSSLTVSSWIHWRGTSGLGELHLRSPSVSSDSTGPLVTNTCNICHGAQGTDQTERLSEFFRKPGGTQASGADLVVVVQEVICT